MVIPSCSHNLARRASDFAKHLVGNGCSFILNTEHYPYLGGECKIFVLENRETKIAIRIEHRVTQFTRVKVEAEVQILEAIKKEKIKHLPVFIGCCLDAVPPMIATTWADGVELKWTDDEPVREIRQALLRTVAEVTLDLLRINGTGQSALQWITDKIDRTRLARCQRRSLPGVSIEDCEHLLLRIPDFHFPQYDLSPSVLVHGDLKSSNIIMKNNQVQCIIDFGMATTVPLQFSPSYPQFLVNEPRQTGDVFDWSHCGYSQIQQDDRRYFKDCIQNLAHTKGEHASIYAEILAHETQEDRHWWLSAVSRLDMMRALKTKP